MFGLFKKKDADKQENVLKITADKANEIIKTLSGGEIKYTKKVIDNVIVFSNASGGTGASTILSNVAYTMASNGLRVLVIDLNINYPIQHLYFGDTKKQDLVKPDLIGFLTGKNTLGEAIETSGKVSVMYAHNRTLMDYINAEADSQVSNFHEAIQKLRQLYDIILIDCPMKIEHTLLNSVFYMADSIYLVWDEGISSIANTEKIRRNMAASGVDTYSKMRIILNKRTNIQYNDYPFKKLGVELVQILPFDTEIIYSSLKSEVFCDKGASNSKNANIFYNSIVELTSTILRNGGLVE